MDRLTVADAARRLGRHPELVRRWLREGRLKGESFAGVWMISERDVERLMRAQPLRWPRVRWVRQESRLFHATTFGDHGKPSLRMFCGKPLDRRHSRTWELTSQALEPVCQRCLSIVDRGRR